MSLNPDPAAWFLDPMLLPVPISTFPASGPDALCLLEKLLFRSKHPMSRLGPRVPPLAPIVVSEDAVEVMPPPPEKKREIVLGLPASNAVHHRGTFKSWGCRISEEKRCTRSEEGEVSARLSQHRSKFVSLIDGMLGDCGLEVTRLSKELDSSRETLKRTEAVLQSIESTHAAQTSTLEARISDLERDLGKTVSSLLKAKEEKKSKSSEVRRLKRRIQRFEETGTCTAVELAGPSSSGTLVRGGEEVGEGNGEAVPALGESEMKAVSRRTPRLINP
ncbi:Uncharacterized protein Rs2_50995 [Raphanus sativus]|nr:Uncharacterized protein Rs2_50995 [Raphanus sativus]